LLDCKTKQCLSFCCIEVDVTIQVLDENKASTSDDPDKEDEEISDDDSDDDDDDDSDNDTKDD
jgi:hypothetical protein